MGPWLPGMPQPPVSWAAAPLPSAAINPGCVPRAGSHTAGERLVHCSTPRQQWHGRDQTLV